MGVPFCLENIRSGTKCNKILSKKPIKRGIFSPKITKNRACGAFISMFYIFLKICTNFDISLWIFQVAREWLLREEKFLQKRVLTVENFPKSGTNCRKFSEKWGLGGSFCGKKKCGWVLTVKGRGGLGWLILAENT